MLGKEGFFLEFEGQNAPAFQLIAKRPNRKRRVSSVFPCVYFKYLVHVLALSLFLFSSCKTAEPELRTNSQEWMNESINALYTCTKQMIFVVTSRYGCHLDRIYIMPLWMNLETHIFADSLTYVEKWFYKCFFNASVFLKNCYCRDGYFTLLLMHQMLGGDLTTS